MLRPMLAMTSLILFLSAGCTDRNHRNQISFRAFEKPMVPPEHTVKQSAPFKKPEMNVSILKKGQTLYEGNCVACHGYTGNGDGVVTKKGLTAPLSFTSEKLINTPESHIVDVITNGYGRMVSLRRKLSEEERWMVAGYVKALQLSRKFPAKELTESDRSKLP